jgi:5-methylcytosine-specific restriction endonuclease McrA
MDKHRERRKAEARAKRAENPEAARAKSRAFYQRNKKRIREDYRKNPEKYRASHRAWKARNPEKARAASRNNYPKVALWLKQHPEKAAEYQSRRRLRKKATASEDCTSRMALLRLMPLCQYCFNIIQNTPTIDHVIPLHRAGEHKPSNLVAACKPCNSSKRNKLVCEWSGLKEAA